MKYEDSLIYKKNHLKQSVLFFALYTIIFAVTSILCYLYYFVHKKTFFTTYDAYTQHISALSYYGNYLRSILHSIFIEGKFELPQWDFNIGFGADIITTLHYYVIGDPFALFSVFVQPKNTPVLYNFLIFLRLYAAGFAFLVYCIHHKFQKFPSLCGSVIYVFCGFSFYCASRHPYFINPMTWLPLLCLGIDWIFEKRNFLLFSAVVFVSCASNFYFFYMLTILVLTYAFVRFFFYFKKDEYKNIYKYILLALAGYVLGVCMASVLFLPNIDGFFNCARTGEETDLSLLYSPAYYIKMLLGIVAPSTFGSYSVLGFSAPSLLLILCLCMQKDKISKEIKLFLLIGIIFFLLPIFGSVFNGFSYVSNRWCFAFSFVFAIGCVHAIPKFLSGFIGRKKYLFIFCLFFCIAVFVISCVSLKTREQMLFPYSVLFISTIMLAAFYHRKNILAPLLFSLLLVSVIINANFRFSPNGLDYLKNCPTITEYKQIQKESLEEFPIEDDSFFRVETEELSCKNSPAVAGIKGTTYYWSIADKCLNEFYIENNLKKNDAQSSSGLDGKEDLYKLINIKYYLSKTEPKKLLEKHFIYTGKNFAGYKIYEYTEFQPFGTGGNGECFSNVKIETNSFTAESNFSSDSKVFLSIPYSKNWNVEIDGIKTSINKANTAFMEINVPKGKHDIKFLYRNQWFVCGFILSLLSFSLFFLLVVFRIKIAIRK